MYQWLNKHAARSAVLDRRKPFVSPTTDQSLAGKQYQVGIFAPYRTGSRGSVGSQFSSQNAGVSGSSQAANANLGNSAQSDLGSLDCSVSNGSVFDSNMMSGHEVSYVRNTYLSNSPPGSAVPRGTAEWFVIPSIDAQSTPSTVPIGESTNDGTSPSVAEVACNLLRQDIHVRLARPAPDERTCEQWRMKT